VTGYSVLGVDLLPDFCQYTFCGEIIKGTVGRRVFQHHEVAKRVRKIATQEIIGFSLTRVLSSAFSFQKKTIL
jgi:hypothetical protein